MESFEQFIKNQENEENSQKRVIDHIKPPNFQEVFNGNNQQVRYPAQQMGGQPQQQYPVQQSQQRSLQQMQDPFQMAAYQNVNVPNTPISYGGGMADSLLNNSEIPQEIMEKYWAFVHKDNVLSFQDVITKNEKLINFDIVKVDLLTNTPYYDYDFKMELEFNTMRHVLDTKLDRAKGFSTGGKPLNERIILQSQFSENRNINENNDSDIKTGFFKRLLGRKN